MGNHRSTAAPPPDPMATLAGYLIQAALALRNAKPIAKNLKEVELEKVYWETCDALTIVVQSCARLNPHLAELYPRTAAIDALSNDQMLELSNELAIEGLAHFNAALATSGLVKP